MAPLRHTTPSAGRLLLVLVPALAAVLCTPMLLTIGELDFHVPLNTTLETWSVLQRLQIPSRLIVFPEENHWILNAENSRFFYRVVQDWLRKYLLD
jgi:dipeptidyl aminopeptidase/acylaminoacyl peptidase